MNNYISYTSTNTGDWGGFSSETFVFHAKNNKEALEMISYYLYHYPGHMNARLEHLDRINEDGQIVEIANNVLPKKVLKSRLQFAWIAKVLDDSNICTKLHGTIRNKLMARIGFQNIDDAREFISRCRPFDKAGRKKQLTKLQSGFWAFDKGDLDDIQKFFSDKGYGFFEKTTGDIKVEKIKT